MFLLDSPQQLLTIFREYLKTTSNGFEEGKKAIVGVGYDDEASYHPKTDDC